MVVDDDYELHVEACAFLAGPAGAGPVGQHRAGSTPGRVAVFLSWCAAEGLDWATPRLDHLVRFKRWLVVEPLPRARPRRGRAEAVSLAKDRGRDLGRRYVSSCGSAPATTWSTLPWCDRLHEPRHLRFLPPGYQAGEDEQFRTVRSRVLRFAAAEVPFAFLEPEQIAPLVAAAGNPRDRCLVALIAMTGIRIGEALGLHRQDMHLLADSRDLGCPIGGPHLHVRRRRGNANGALAKSRFPRSIPVPTEAIRLVCRLPARARRTGSTASTSSENPLVFVNLYRAPLGGGVGYRSAKEMFDRLAPRDRVDGAAAPAAPHRRDDLAAPRHTARHRPAVARPRLTGVDAALPAPERGRHARRGRDRRGMGPDMTAITPRRQAGNGSEQAMISWQATAPAPIGASRVDRNAWMVFLQKRLAPGWRPGEFDPEVWLFTGDPDNPATTSTRCLVARCATVVNSRTLCSGCERALAVSDIARDAFLATHRPVKPRSARLTGQTCVVTHDGVGCGRRRISNLSGLCNSHGSAWCRYRDGGGTLTVEQWRDQHARPLPPVPACQVPGCAHDATVEIGADGDSGHELCTAHRRAWRRSQSGRARGKRISPQQWAQRQQRLGRDHQFSLVAVEPVLRRELLYALQQRDGQGHKIDPVAMRALVKCFADPDDGLDTLSATTYEQLVVLLPRNDAVRSYARILTRIVGLAFEQFRGIVHTERDVWDCLALDLAEPRAGRRANLATVDFTPIVQRWLRDAAKQWAHTVRPDGQKLSRAVQACTLASHALAQRPGGGHRPGELSFADMTVVFDAFTRATRPDGQRYNSHYRRGLWARLHAVLDFGRATGELAELAATFHRHSTHVDPRRRAQRRRDSARPSPRPSSPSSTPTCTCWQDGHRYGRAWSPCSTPPRCSRPPTRSYATPAGAPASW